MKKQFLPQLAVLCGIILLATGFYLLKVVGEPQGMMVTLPYVLIGIGSGAFGGGLGEWIQRRAVKNNPALEKQMEITRKDERNIAIGNRAKAKAYDMMVYIFGALMLCFTLMNVETRVILLLVGSYLFVIGYGVYFRIRYDKEM